MAVAFVVWSIFSAHRAAATSPTRPRRPRIVTVSTTHPKPTDPTGSELVLPGTVQANIDAPIYARTSGYLKRWLVDIGARVKAGQLLAEIDTPEVQQQLSQAEADVATAEANQRIAAVTAERWQSLRKTDWCPGRMPTRRRASRMPARRSFDSARANLARLRDLNGFQRIVAPFDGIITARDTDVGQLIAGRRHGSRTVPHQRRTAAAPVRAGARRRSPRRWVRPPRAQVSFPDRPGVTFTARMDPRRTPSIRRPTPCWCS